MFNKLLKNWSCISAKGKEKIFERKRGWVTKNLDIKLMCVFELGNNSETNEKNARRKRY